MKYVLLASGMALGLALQPVQAEEQDGAKAKSHEQETLHAPTNRVGEMIPTMTAPSNTDDQASPDSAASDNEAETMHAPTNRVGDQVPTMTDGATSSD